MSLLLLFQGLYTPPSGTPGQSASFTVGFFGMASVDPQESFDLAVDAFLNLLSIDGTNPLAVSLGVGWIGQTATRVV